MRQFWLLSENTKDFLIDLQEKDAFGADPDGLGLEVNASGYRAGTDLIYYNEQPTYESMKFTMVYGAESSEPYATFTNFMSKLNGQKLVLAYKPDDRAYDPEENFRPAYLYNDDIIYPEYTLESSGSTTVTKSVKKSYTLSTKTVKTVKGKKKAYYKTTVTNLEASDYDSFTVKIAYNPFGTTVYQKDAFSFTVNGNEQTKTSTITKKKNKKTTYKVSIKAVYNGVNQIVFTVNASNKATPISTKKKITVTYDYSKPQSLSSVVPSGDSTEMPSSAVTTTVTPVNDVATVTISPSNYTSFGVYALYSIGTNTDFLSTSGGEFTVGDEKSYDVKSVGRSFTIAYDGDETLTIESNDISTVTSYQVTIQYSNLDLGDANDEESVDYSDYELEVMNESIYFRKVKFVSATKGELEHEVGWLLSDLTLAPTTPWFRWEPVDIPGTHVDKMPIDTEGCVLFSNAIQTVPLKVHYLVKYTAKPFKVTVQYYDILDPTKKFTSEVSFNTQVPAGATIEINSDFEEFSVRWTNDNGVTWTNMLPSLATSGVGFARVRANGVSYIDFSGTDEYFNSTTDKIWFRKELVII